MRFCRDKFIPAGSSSGLAAFLPFQKEDAATRQPYALLSTGVYFCSGQNPVFEFRHSLTSPRKETLHMSGVYKITELVGTSPVSFAEAAKAAVAEAAKTVRHMDWLEVVGESARIREGKIEEFQVKVKIGFKIER